MGSRTKIIVLHMKEIIYTAIFAALGILLIVLLVIMFRPGAGKEETGTVFMVYSGQMVRARQL